MDREFYHFKNAASLDLDDVLLKVQRAFSIRFESNELAHVTNLGDLCEVIQNKITVQHEDTCTTQHAFYMLRNAIAATTGTDKCSIKPHSRLVELFPKENRLEAISNIEKELGFKLDLLQPKQWIVGAFSLIFIASLIMLYFSWQIGLPGCLASILALRLAGKFGKEIHLKTLGDVANKISRESHLKARRNPTIKRNEIEQKVRGLFAEEFILEPALLSRRSSFR